MDESTKKLYFKLPKGSAEGKDGKGNIFTLKKGSAVYLYSRTSELPFSSIYKICGNINSIIMKELKEAILEHSLHPLAKFSVYESKNKITERGNTMISLRVIYKPEIDKVHCKKIEGKDPFDALLNFAKLYDVEVDEDIIEDQAFLDLIDLLTDDERVNLRFLQNAETGETYHDIAFQ